MKSFIIACVMFALSTNAIAAEPVICRNLLINYDIERLEEELRLVEGYYMPLYLGHDHWTAIPLRNATGAHTQEGVQLHNTLKKTTMLPCKDTAFLEQLPYIAFVLDDISKKFDAEIGLVRLSNVPSQKKIKNHRDGPMFDLHKGTIYRLHIPIKTGQDVIFEVDGNSYNLEPGTLYFTNVSLSHAVTNNGPFDRIHLVIDVQACNPLQNHILQSPEVVFHKL